MITARLTQQRYEEQRKQRRDALLQSRPNRDNIYQFAKRDEEEEDQTQLSFKEKKKRQRIVMRDTTESKMLAEKVTQRRDRTNNLEHRLARYLQESTDRDEELAFLESRLDVKDEEIHWLVEQKRDREKQLELDQLLQDYGDDDADIAQEAEMMRNRRKDLTSDNRDISDMAGFLQGVGVDPWVGNILDLVKHLDAELSAKDQARALTEFDKSGASKEDEISRMNSAVEKEIKYVRCVYEKTETKFRIGDAETVDQLLGDCSRFFEVPAFKIKLMEPTGTEALKGSSSLGELIVGKTEEPLFKVVLKNADEWDLGGGGDESSSESEKEGEQAAEKKDDGQPEKGGKATIEAADDEQKVPEKTAEELEEEEFNRKSKEIDEGDEEVKEELMYRWNNFRAVLRPAEERLLAKIFYKDTLRKNNEKAKDYCRLGLHFCFLLLLVCSSLLRRPPNDAFHMAEMIKDEVNRPVPFMASTVKFNTAYITGEASPSTTSANSYTISIGPYITFEELADIDDIWKWFFYSTYALFPGKLYPRDNSTGYFRDREATGAFQDGFYMQQENKYYIRFYNRMIGGLRLRQIRIASDSCKVPGEYDKFRSGCYGTYYKLDYTSIQPLIGESTADTSTYTPSDCSAAAGIARGCSDIDSNAWIHRTRTATASYGFGYIDDNVTWDDGSGFVLDIPFDTFSTGQCDISSAALDCNVEWADAYRTYLMKLKWNRWIDLQTRGIFYSFNVYNNFYDMLAVVNLKIIITRSGSVNTFSDIKVIKPTLSGGDRHSITFYVLFTLQYICVFFYWIIFILNILQYTKTQIEKNAKQLARARALARKEAKLNKGRKRRGPQKKTTVHKTSIFQEFINFFFDFWNMLIFLILLLLTGSFILSLTYALHTDRLALDLKMPAFKDLEQLASVYMNIFNLEAAAIFLAFIYSFRYLRSTVRMFLIFSTLSKASRDLIVFVSIFAVIFMAFGMWGFIAFGSQLEQFSTLIHSLYTLEEMMVGEYIYTSMFLANEFIAPVYFIVFILLVFFLLTNVFIALLTEAYYKAKEDERDEEAKDILVSKRLNISSSTAGIIKDSLTALAKSVVERLRIKKIWRALTGTTSV